METYNPYGGLFAVDKEGKSFATSSTNSTSDSGASSGPQPVGE